MVGICVTKKIVVSIAIALIMGSVYTMLFNKNPMSYEEFKIRKETLVAEESKN